MPIRRWVHQIRYQSIITTLILLALNESIMELFTVDIVGVKMMTSWPFKAFWNANSKSINHRLTIVLQFTLPIAPDLKRWEGHRRWCLALSSSWHLISGGHRFLWNHSRGRDSGIQFWPWRKCRSTTEFHRVNNWRNESPISWRN